MNPRHLDNLELPYGQYSLHFNENLHAYQANELITDPRIHIPVVKTENRRKNTLGKYFRAPRALTPSLVINLAATRKYATMLFDNTQVINQNQNFYEQLFLSILGHTYRHEMEHWKQDCEGRLYSKRKTAREMLEMTAYLAPGTIYGVAVSTALTPIVPVPAQVPLVVAAGMFTTITAGIAAMKDLYQRDIHELEARQSEDNTNIDGLFTLEKTSN